MIIRKLDYEAYKGLKYQAEIVSDRYLSIEPAGEGFDIGWVMSDEPLRMSVNDAMLSDWLDHPTAYGAFEGDQLTGFVEGFLEKDGELVGVKLVRPADGERTELAVEGLFVAVGLEPENGAFAPVAKLDDRGYFDSDEDCLTGTPGVFVAGDCRRKGVRQITTAVADGASAAVAACRMLG